MSSDLDMIFTYKGYDLLQKGDGSWFNPVLNVVASSPYKLQVQIDKELARKRLKFSVWSVFSHLKA